MTRNSYKNSLKCLISYSKVRAMTRVATPENEDYLLCIALYDSAESFSHAIDTIAPEIDASTCVTGWTGEDCDYGMAVDGLLMRKAP